MADNSDTYDIMKSITLKPKKKGLSVFREPQPDPPVSSGRRILDDKTDGPEAVAMSSTDDLLVKTEPTRWEGTWLTGGTDEPSESTTLPVSKDSDTTITRDSGTTMSKESDTTPVVIDVKKCDEPLKMEDVETPEEKPKKTPPKVPKRKNTVKKTEIRELPPLTPEDSQEEDGCPSNWATDGWSGPGGYYLIKLRNISDEYCSIHTEFAKQTDKFEIAQIERLENRDLWDKYLFESARMARDRPADADLNECYLFHGTQVEKPRIASEGLDMRLGKIGFFGRGIYLSNNINKSLNYSANADGSAPSELPYILKCRVLLGEAKIYAKGEKNPNLRKEPMRETEKPGYSRYYDSVKGNITGEDEFIVYNNHRVMPEYIITYRLKSGEPDMNASLKQSLRLPSLRPTPVVSKHTKSPTTPVKADKPDPAIKSKDSDTSTHPDGRKAKALKSMDEATKVTTTPWPTSTVSTWVDQTEETSKEFETEEKSQEFESNLTKEEFSHEFDMKDDDASDLSHEFKTGMTKEEFSKEFGDEVDVSMLEGDEYAKEFGEAAGHTKSGVVGRPVSWQPQNDDDHERKLEEVRSSMKEKKHRRFKPKKEVVEEKGDGGKVRAMAKDKTDTTEQGDGDVDSDVPGGGGQTAADQQAIQIREYLKSQHKKLQLRKANEESISKVESLMVAYLETYGSLDAASIQPPLAQIASGTDEPAIKGRKHGKTSTEMEEDTDSTENPPAAEDTVKKVDPPPPKPFTPPTQMPFNPFSPPTQSLPQPLIPPTPVPFTLPPLPPLLTRRALEDPVKEVMDSMIAEFMECTGVTDRDKAAEYIKKGGNNVNDAALLFFQ